MKKLIFAIFLAVMLSGCVVYPGYDYGYYYSDYYYPYAYYSYPYGYVSPSVSLYFSNLHGGHGFHHGGFNHGFHGGWRR